MRSPSDELGACALLLAVTILASPGPVAAGSEPAGAAMTEPEAAGSATRAVDPDQAFIDSLGARYSERSVDTARLAGVLAGSAERLVERLKTLEFLQIRVRAQDAPASGPSALTQAYERLAQAAERFRDSARRLVERPDSPHRLFLVMARGQRACLELDGYVDGLDRAGLAASDRASTADGREACARFRHVVFQPRVEALVLGALEDAGSDAEDAGQAARPRPRGE